MRKNELAQSKGATREQNRRPDFEGIFPTAHAPDEPEGYEKGEKRQLVAGHATQGLYGDIGHALEGQERRSESAVCNRGGVCNQTEARRSKRIESEPDQDRKSTRLNSSHGYISYAVFCLKKKKIT